MTRKLATIVSIMVLGTSLMIGMSAQGALQLHYDFNAGSGSAVANQGAAGAAGDLGLFANDGTPSDLYSADGAGVSGQAGDYALDMNALGDVSAADAGPYAKTSAADPVDLGFWGNSSSDPAEGDVDKLTICTWYNAESHEGNARLLGGEGYFEIRYKVGNGGHWIYSKISDNVSAGGNQWSRTGEWVFLAVVLDETTDTMNWYVGDTSTAVALDQGYTGQTGNIVTPVSSAGQIYPGNRHSDQGRVFDGMIDNVRYYNDALSLSELEALRQGDIIPEPASLALMGLGGLAMLRRRRA